ncbi:MAG: hypothetical protein OCD02_10285 [Spirochaetaceae bacterium]
MIKKTLLVLLILTASTIFSNNIAVLNRAMDKISIDDNKFSFELTTKTIEDDKTDIITVSFNPQDNPQYQLLLKNGEKPTQKEIKAYYKELEEEDESGMDGMFGDDNYVFISEEDGIMQYSFDTVLDFMPGKASKMTGLIWVDEKLEIITKIKLINEEKMKIALGISLSEFVLEFSFEPFNNELCVMTSTNMDMKGKAVLFDFEMRSISRMYNYALVN